MWSTYMPYCFEQIYSSSARSLSIYCLSSPPALWTLVKEGNPWAYFESITVVHRDQSCWSMKIACIENEFGDSFCMLVFYENQWLDCKPVDFVTTSWMIEKKRIFERTLRAKFFVCIRIGKYSWCDCNAQRCAHFCNTQTCIWILIQLEIID